MFIGEYLHTMDSKGRLFIPAKFREALGEVMVATKGLDGCLCIYPMDEWQQVADKLKKLPFTRADARAFQRFVFSGATECELDKQGRILLAPSLRDYAGLTKDVIVIGVSTRVEVWDVERWQEYNGQTAERFEDVAENLIDFEL
ncbi:division/cell wall cluster transcriptional repressor MraZ [Heliophilum fasciatum]|uniref:Transcriptional regulator MraZ n=1 Tax=Heliophilum fasciatum TaxID=35700 RepID=A0A4R2RG19_9FIRM|nr:division/cell wall cluster transcriptional repressor MraZ [Heliophilum fasciatum]MCW2279091.1 MraZ protein [Heliophilum fasciatum]TCP61488.1 MraZ protein [Heliophilum fasciatum]